MAASEPTVAEPLAVIARGVDAVVVTFEPARRMEAVGVSEPFVVTPVKDIVGLPLGAATMAYARTMPFPTVLTFADMLYVELMPVSSAAVAKGVRLLMYNEVQTEMAKPRDAERTTVIVTEVPVGTSAR